ncbi:MAG: hypothetical protein U0V54_06670 [Saprospiraceae bacterium]
MTKSIYIIIAILLWVIIPKKGMAQDDPNAPAIDKAALRVPGEDDYYAIRTIPTPENVLIEGGGVAVLPDGSVAVATRRGDVWVIGNVEGAGGQPPHYTLFASGLHEPLGCVYANGSLYAAQRGELTRLQDTDGDGYCDVYETIYAWPLSGHYHEYSFGPVMGTDGSFFVTANVAFGDEEWWRGESRVPMRGWTMRITPDGKMEPWATGMRSPCGTGMVDGEMFYDDNQGDWIGSGAIWHVKKGAFTGHPAGLKWTDKIENSPIQLTVDSLYAKVNPRQVKNKYGKYIKPENIEKEQPQTFYELKQKFPEVQLPAVWLPHGILGVSNAEIKQDKTGGMFGPFEGQLFVGDQGQSKIMRVFLEKVNGEYQGAAFDFRNNFQSGVLRMDWTHDGSLIVGETNRGWGSAGNKDEGIQRLEWTGKLPFEMKTVKATTDGFEIEFTKPAKMHDIKDLGQIEAYSFIYKYHPVYGSPPIDRKALQIEGVKWSDDGLKLRLMVNNRVRYHIHEINLRDIKSADGLPLLHPTVYYTLNAIPDGKKPDMAEYKKYVYKPTVSAKNKSAATGKKASVSSLEAEVKPLLTKYTCSSCHNANKKQIGPAYKDIAARKYSNERIVQLIWKPEPSNWPGYATEMAPLPNVPKADGLKIAAWINSLK